ncbi:MAG: ATP-binding cassette domain-containing protein [Nitrospinae bacterium]|nr:ATP-binding cassette domain-containing protein [Nitrospinota bacterium]MBL7020238.1 ATP-binding cassette domain-containing protein [Nitrospinaceae bacterium]
MNTKKGIPLLEVQGLKKHFFPQMKFLEEQAPPVRAVDGISFTLQAGETLGLVGESGCGKSTAARTLLRLIEPTSGQVNFCGTNLFDLKETALRSLRREMQIIFQDPYSSVNPARRIGHILQEPFEIHGCRDKKENAEKATQLLERVGLTSGHFNRYPHELSGGQLQRVGIARAIALNPKLVVADEPVSALDVSIQAQIINLLLDLKEKLDISYLFISHDMGVVEYFCDRVAVMYLGKIVEIAHSEQIYNSPMHPYTTALLNAIPSFEPGRIKQKTSIRGDIPDPAILQRGCAFHSRCPIKEKKCEDDIPALEEITPGHHVACFFK